MTTSIQDRLHAFAVALLERRGGLVEWPDGGQDGTAVVTPEIADAFRAEDEMVQLSCRSGGGGLCVNLATDFLDGYIARRFDQRSDLGRIIDPIVDKISILVVTFYMVISPVYKFPLWFFIFVLARELILMVGSSLVIKKKDIVMESNRPGKNSAFAVGVVVILFVLGLQPYGWIVLWIAFILTVYSSYIYLRLFLEQLKLKSSTKKSRD